MRRIHRAVEKEDVITSLMTNEVGIFNEIWRLLLFAAQVGIKNGRRVPLGSIDSGKGIDQSTFGNCPAWPGIVYLMSLVETNASTCLSGTAKAEDERIDLFQEYANGGLAILQDYFTGRLCNLDGLLSFIDSQSVEAAGKVDLDLTI